MVNYVFEDLWKEKAPNSDFAMFFDAGTLKLR
jgi:hypothetical protein